MKWEKYFDEIILKRGEGYYKKGKVIDFQTDGRLRTATVIGSDEYAVLIEFDDAGEVADMQCNCPYAEKSEYCKHMAAVMFREYCGEAEVDPPKAKKETAKTFQSKNDFYIKKIARHNCDFTLTDIKDEIKRIISSYKNRGFIEYRYAYTCAVHVNETVQKNAEILIENEKYKDAFDYVFFSLRKFCSTEMDDSDGGTTMFFDNGLEICRQILQNEEAERYVFKKLIKYNASDSEWYLEDRAEDFLFDNFNKQEFYEQKMQYLENKIADVREKSDPHNYALDRYLKTKIDLMRKMNVSEQEFERFRKKNWAFSEVQKYCIEEKIKNKEYQEAERLLCECLVTKSDSGVSTEYCREKLLFVYKETKNNEKYRTTLFDSVCFDFDLTDKKLVEKYKELKGLFCEDEWLSLKGEILQNIKKSNEYFLPEIYLLEEMREDLLNYALSYDGLTYIKQYEKELLPEYSVQVFEKYKIELQKMAEHSYGGREAYKEIACQLRKLTRYAEGKLLVKDLIAEWRIKYPRRRAMMEELDKIAV